jgi:class 3 adenylate cyclase
MGDVQTATVLFTDLVGSTSVFHSLGEERADDERRRHFAMLAKAISRHGGRVVKGLGDGLMA